MYLPPIPMTALLSWIPWIFPLNHHVDPQLPCQHHECPRTFNIKLRSIWPLKHADQILDKHSYWSTLPWLCNIAQQFLTQDLDTHNVDEYRKMHSSSKIETPTGYASCFEG